MSKLQRRHTTSLVIWPRYRIKLVMCKWTMRVLICADSMFFHCQCSSPLPASFFLPLRCKDPQCRRLPFLLALPYPIWRRKSGAARLLGARPHIFVKSPRPCLIPYLEIWISTHDPRNIVIWPDRYIYIYMYMYIYIHIYIYIHLFFIKLLWWIMVSQTTITGHPSSGDDHTKRTPPPSIY